MWYSSYQSKKEIIIIFKKNKQIIKKFLNYSIDKVKRPC